jgi:hypothetical protein
MTAPLPATFFDAVGSCVASELHGPHHVIEPLRKRMEFPLAPAQSK